MEDRYMIAFYGECIDDIVIYTTGVLSKLGYTCAIADFTKLGHISDYLPLPKGFGVRNDVDCSGIMYHYFGLNKDLIPEAFLSDAVICLFDSISDARLKSSEFDRSIFIINENIPSLRQECNREDAVITPDAVIIRNYTGQSMGMLSLLSAKYNVKNMYALEYDSVDAVTLFRKGLCQDSEIYRVSPGMREIIRQIISEILPGVDESIVGKAVTKLFGRWR